MGARARSKGVSPARSVTLRPAAPADLADLCALEAASFATSEERFGARQVRGLIVNPRALTVVAHDGRAVFGWASGLPRKHAHGRSGRLYALAVHPDAQGRGLGRLLAERVIHDLRDA